MENDNKLYEWSLKNVGLALGAGAAALLGKGLKMVYDSAVVKAVKGQLDAKLEEFRAKIDTLIKEKVRIFNGQNKNREITDKVRSSFEKKLSSYINKELEVLSKTITNTIDNKRISDKKKNSVKLYWESITTSIELEIFEKLHKFNLISGGEKEKRSKEAAGGLEELVKAFTETFDPDRQEKEKDKIEKIQAKFEEFKAKLQNKGVKLNTTDLKSQFVKDIKGLKTIIDSIYEKVSLSNQNILEGIKGGLVNIGNQIGDYEKDVMIDKYKKNLKDRLSIFKDSKKNIIQRTLGDQMITILDKEKNLNAFVSFIVGEVLDDTSYYEKEKLILKGKSLTDKATLQFLKKFEGKFMDWVKEQSSEKFDEEKPSSSDENTEEEDNTEEETVEEKEVILDESSKTTLFDNLKDGWKKGNKDLEDELKTEFGDEEGARILKYLRHDKFLKKFVANLFAKINASPGGFLNMKNWIKEDFTLDNKSYVGIIKDFKPQWETIFKNTNESFISFDSYLNKL